MYLIASSSLSSLIS